MWVMVARPSYPFFFPHFPYRTKGHNRAKKENAYYAPENSNFPWEKAQAQACREEYGPD